jgi:hypothetical protein
MLLHLLQLLNMLIQIPNLFQILRILFNNRVLHVKDIILKLFSQTLALKIRSNILQPIHFHFSKLGLLFRVRSLPEQIKNLKTQSKYKCKSRNSNKRKLYHFFLIPTYQATLHCLYQIISHQRPQNNSKYTRTRDLKLGQSILSRARLRRRSFCNLRQLSRHAFPAVSFTLSCPIAQLA